jgi:hypothetical protein
MTIYPSKNWTVAYMYYNAKNAKEYEIIYDDYFTSEFGKEGDMGVNDKSNAMLGGYWNNFTVKPGENIGTDEDGYYYEISYKMPTKKTNGQPLTGEYYLVLMADAYDVIDEENEDNNFYFITAANGKPLEFKDGVVQNMPPRTKSSLRQSSVEKRPALFSNTENQTTVVPDNLNAYTPAEIKAMLIHDKKTGKLDEKRKEFRNRIDGKPFSRELRK